MLRALLRSTLYSSRRPFSSNATRRSSFSTLTTNLLPVLRDVRPKIFFTLSNINFETLRDRERKHGQRVVHCSLDRHWLLKTTANRSWRGLRCRPFDSKKAFKKVWLARGRGRNGARDTSAFHFSLRIGLLLDIRRSIVARHLHIGALAVVGAFFVLAPEFTSSVAHCFNQLERIRMMCGCEPRDLHIELSFILRENAFENARSDRARHFAAVPRRPLHHHCDDILRMLKWRETHKPRHVFLVTTLGGLRSTSFAGHHNIF